MSACDCKKSSQRTVARIDPGPPQVNTVANVVIDSSCQEVVLPGGGGGGSEEFALVALVEGRGSDRKSHGKKKGGRTLCVNTINVRLVADSTPPGLKIVELQTGIDTVALDVAVGKNQEVRSFCSACKEGTAKVRIVDATGATFAVLGGFAICECVP